jgi:hypothetical protein
MQYPPIRPIVTRLTAALGAVVVILTVGIQVAEAQVSTPRNPYCIRDGVFGSGSWDCSYHNWQQCCMTATRRARVVHRKSELPAERQTAKAADAAAAQVDSAKRRSPSPAFTLVVSPKGRRHAAMVSAIR